MDLSVPAQDEHSSAGSRPERKHKTSLRLPSTQKAIPENATSTNTVSDSTNSSDAMTDDPTRPKKRQRQEEQGRDGTNSSLHIQMVHSTVVVRVCWIDRAYELVRAVGGEVKISPLVDSLQALKELIRMDAGVFAPFPDLAFLSWDTKYNMITTLGSNERVANWTRTLPQQQSVAPEQSWLWVVPANMAWNSNKYVQTIEKHLQKEDKQKQGTT